MKGRMRMVSHVRDYDAGASWGGKPSHYREKQTIYSQGTPASTLFYIQEGGVRLTTRSKDRRPAVTAILGAGDFFGEICLAGFPLRRCTAVALTASSIKVIKKKTMIRVLRRKNAMSTPFVSHLLSSIKRYQDHVVELLTSSAEQRLALVLLRLARLGRGGLRVAEIPTLSHTELAEMIGTTRPRVNLFMNRFRKRGFISYNGHIHIKVHKSLQQVLRRH